MRRILPPLLFLAGVVLALCIIRGQHLRIQQLTSERDRYKGNTEALMTDVERFQVRDSLSAARVEALELTVKEFERFRSEDAALIREMIAIAHGEGFAVMAHANGAQTIRDALEAGVDSIEHGAYMDGDTVRALARSGAVWVPTLSTVGNLIGNGRYPEFFQTLVEGWRGEICHCAITDAQGNLLHYKIKDPSFHNWLGLALAVRNNEISDFPICNKSFDLSYSGHDL